MFWLLTLNKLKDDPVFKVKLTEVYGLSLVDFTLRKCKCNACKM